MLLPIGWLYGKIIDIRNWLYDRGTFRSHDLGGRTVSIGNITAGGTGKTPLVAHVAEILAEQGNKVCILTRGYGRENASERVLVSNGESVLVDARLGGDEPVELARKLIRKAIVVADADRVRAASWARQKFGVTAFILDDGFQHRRARRDLDIVCVDATDPSGGGRVLPAGRLREPFHNLSRARAIVVTRTNLVEDIDATIACLRRQNSTAPIFISRNRLVGVTKLNEYGSVHGWDLLRGSGGTSECRILAFCGLGNPKAFFTDIRAAFYAELMHDEFDLAVVKDFPDHHHYSQHDIDALEQRARDANVHALVTTAKDAVKLEGLKFELPCFVLQAALVMDDPDGFRDLVLSA